MRRTPEHEIKITNLLEVPTAEPERPGKLDVWVWYTFDGAGPFYLRVPKEQWTDEEFKKRVMDQQAERLKQIGRTLKVTD